MLKRRNIFLSVMALLMAWVLLLSPGALFSLKPRLNVEGFKRVKPGMHLEEVERLMGGPPGEYGRYASTGSTHTTLEGFDCPPGSNQFPGPPTGLRWTNDDHSFEFCFDEEGVLIAKHERAEYGRSPGILARILTVLGLCDAFC